MVITMPIEIKDKNKLKDNNGGLGKALLIQDEVIFVYRVKPIARYCNCNINIVNPTTSNAEVKLWVSSENTPGNIDLIESKIVLAPDAVYVRTNMVVGPNEAVFAQSNINGPVIRMEGFENNPL